jgi:hypothetical protein
MQINYKRLKMRMSLKPVASVRLAHYVKLGHLTTPTGATTLKSGPHCKKIMALLPGAD